MSPKERLIRYFDLSRRQSTLSFGEHQELLHLEEALVDDIDKVDLPDELYKLQWKFISDAIDIFCGPYAVLDTGSSWNVMEVLINEAFPKLSAKDRLKIADMVGGKIAVAKADFVVKEIKRKYKRKRR